MNTQRLTLWITIISLLVVGSGVAVWNAKKEPFLKALYERQSFLLLDDKNNFYGTKDLKKDEKLLLIFTPDAISPAFVPSLHQFASALAILAQHKIQVALVSRVHADIVHNFKTAAAYEGRVLLDPSGSVGRLTGLWDNDVPSDTWGYALVDKDFHLLWTKKSDHILQLTELAKF